MTESPSEPAPEVWTEPPVSTITPPLSAWAPCAPSPVVTIEAPPDSVTCPPASATTPLAPVPLVMTVIWALDEIVAPPLA